MKTQNEMILEMLSDGWVSPLDALREAGCLRLGARVFDLKAEGKNIEERWVDYESRFGSKRYKEFRLKKRSEFLFDLA